MKVIFQVEIYKISKILEYDIFETPILWYNILIKESFTINFVYNLNIYHIIILYINIIILKNEIVDPVYI